MIKKALSLKSVMSAVQSGVARARAATAEAAYRGGRRAAEAGKGIAEGAGDLGSNLLDKGVASTLANSVRSFRMLRQGGYKSPRVSGYVASRSLPVTVPAGAAMAAGVDAALDKKSAYADGFVAKCAQYGLSEQAVMKLAQLNGVQPITPQQAAAGAQQALSLPQKTIPNAEKYRAIMQDGYGPNYAGAKQTGAAPQASAAATVPYETIYKKRPELRTQPVDYMAELGAAFKNPAARLAESGRAIGKGVSTVAPYLSPYTMPYGMARDVGKPLLRMFNKAMTPESVGLRTPEEVQAQRSQAPQSSVWQQGEPFGNTDAMNAPGQTRL